MIAVYDSYPGENKRAESGQAFSYVGRASIFCSAILMAILHCASPATAQRIYWADDGTNKIQTGNSSGRVAGAVTTLFDSSDGLSNVTALALDVIDGTIYWGTGANVIQSGNLDGTGVPVTLFDTGDGVQGVASIALDATAGKLYWCESGSGAIKVGNLDGSGAPTTLFNALEAPPTAVAVNPLTAKVYWSEFQYIPPQTIINAVRAGNTDGSGTPETLYDETDGLTTVTTIALDIAGEQIFWGDAINKTIQVASIHGRSAGPPATVLGTPDWPVNISLDLGGGRVYWTEQNTTKLYGGSLSGESGGPSQVLYDETDALGSAAKVAVDGPGGLVYWASGAKIEVGSVQGHGSGLYETLFDTDPKSIALDPAAGKVYWLDSSSNSIKIGNMDGSGAPEVLIGGTRTMTGMAVDIPAGKIYWTQGSVITEPEIAVFGDIQVASIDGSGDVTTLYTEADGFYLPGGIAVDSVNGDLYWGDLVGFTIQKGDIGGNTVAPATTLLSTGSTGYEPIQIALDVSGGKMYWANGGINVVNLDGSGATSLFGSASSCVAVDFAGGKIYWGDGSNIKVGNIDGSGTPTILYGATDGLIDVVGVVIDLPARVDLESLANDLAPGGTTAVIGGVTEELPFVLSDSALQITTPVTATDSSGTLVDLPIDTVVNFPPGTAVQSIVISTPLVSPVAASQLPDPQTAIPIARTFGPSGTQFFPPITVTIPYTDAQVANISDPAEMIPYLYNESTQTFEPIESEYLDTVVVDTVGHTISFQVDHFSTWGIGGPKAITAPQPPWLLVVLGCTLLVIAGRALRRRRVMR